jgi:hypothetical protein
MPWFSRRSSIQRTQGSRHKRVLRLALDQAASILLRLSSGGKQPMICSELLYRSYAEAEPPGRYELAVSGVSYAAMRSAVETLAADADDETRELERARQAFLTAYQAARVLRPREAEPPSSPEGWLVPDFVTPTRS